MQTACCRYQDLVADIVAKAVVDLLEMVAIDNRDTVRAAVGAAVEMLFQTAAVGNVGQRVERRRQLGGAHIGQRPVALVPDAHESVGHAHCGHYELQRHGGHHGCKVVGHHAADQQLVQESSKTYPQCGGPRHGLEQRRAAAFPDRFGKTQGKDAGEAQQHKVVEPIQPARIHDGGEQRDGDEADRQHQAQQSARLAHDHAALDIGGEQGAADGEADVGGYRTCQQAVGIAYAKQVGQQRRERPDHYGQRGDADDNPQQELATYHRKQRRSGAAEDKCARKKGAKRGARPIHHSPRCHGTRNVPVPGAPCLASRHDKLVNRSGNQRYKNYRETHDSRRLGGLRNCRENVNNCSVNHKTRSLSEGQRTGFRGYRKQWAGRL